MSTSPAQRYRIDRLIKRGAAAEVLEARIVGESAFERRVIIKRLREEAALDESFVHSFIDEARIAGQLHHSNIVGVLDFGIMDGLPFQVLELVDGIDARELMRLASASGSPIPLEVALHIAMETALALAYVHQAVDARGRWLSVVHRDVTPENILIEWSGTAKLSDFGIAFALRRAEATQVGITKGKLAYMAPEQSRGDAVDGKADTFALGCVLHELLAGRSPLDDEREQTRVLAGGDCALDESIPEDVRAIIRRATRSNRAHRYPSASDLAVECEDLLAARGFGRARARVQAYMTGLRPRAAPPPAPAEKGLGQLLDVEALLLSGGPVRRFESRRAVPPGEEEVSAAAQNTDPRTAVTVFDHRVSSAIDKLEGFDDPSVTDPDALSLDPVTSEVSDVSVIGVTEAPESDRTVVGNTRARMDTVAIVESHLDVIREPTSPSQTQPQPGPGEPRVRAGIVIPAVLVFGALLIASLLVVVIRGGGDESNELTSIRAVLPPEPAQRAPGPRAESAAPRDRLRVLRGKLDRAAPKLSGTERDRFEARYRELAAAVAGAPEKVELATEIDAVGAELDGAAQD